MTNDTVTGLLFGGAKAAKFANIGDTIKGQICGYSTRQETAYGSGELLTFPDGQPRMQIVIELDTDLSDGPDDDGRRTVYCKRRMAKAIGEALRKAGGSELQEGATLTIKYVGDATAEGTFAPAKLFKAKYEPPVASVDIDLDDF